MIVDIRGLRMQCPTCEEMARWCSAPPIENLNDDVAITIEPCGHARTVHGIDLALCTDQFGRAQYPVRSAARP